MASHTPGPRGTYLLLAAQNAYSIGMSEVLRVGIGVMVVAALVISAFMPERAQTVSHQPSAPEAAPAELATSRSRPRL
ncbi:MAG TPA: hypothetical protein VKK19_03900 [Candidatus Dormibacteraeota bacterium]|nr:hypothetical protein [Candidatus Dormibacteraeota bacterium]